MKCRHITFKDRSPGIGITYTPSEESSITSIAGIKKVKNKPQAVGKLTPALLKRLKENNAIFSPILNHYWKKFIDTKLCDILYPFQIDGVWFVERKNGRTLIADEMGLGKTVQALCWLKIQPEIIKTLVIVPAAVKLNWAGEIRKWLPNYDVRIANGITPHKINGDIIVINYDILNHWKDELKKQSIKCVIIDEIHYIKNSASLRTKAVKKVAKKVDHVIGLSGTPILNRPKEIINTVRLIDKSVIPNQWSFLHRYCGPKRNPFGIEFKGATNKKELHEKLVNSIMIRRKKKDVLTDLPAKQKAFIPADITNMSEYKQADKDIVKYILKTKGMEAADRALRGKGLAKRAALRQIVGMGKIKAAVDWIQDFLESGEKLVVMAIHKTVIDALMQKFKNRAVKVDGSVTQKQKQDAVDKFQNNDKHDLFIGNIKAAGVGLTLTAASNALILEFPAAPGDLEQAEDRIHRISQTKKVTIHYLYGVGTFEKNITEFIDNKAKVISMVMDGKYSDDPFLTELVNNMNK